MPAVGEHEEAGAGRTVDHSQLHAIAENNRPIAQRVGADRRHRDDAGTGVHDGSARRQIVGRRAGRGGEDEAVAEVVGHEVAVGVHFKAHQAGVLLVLDQDVVERQFRRGSLGRALQHRPPVQPEVIDIEIDFDGTIVWNGTPISDVAVLEKYFRVESQKDPQPELHMRPDKRAKYDTVAKVLASAQRNRMKKIGFVNVAEFAD